MAAPDIPFLNKQQSKKFIRPGLQGGLGALGELLQNPGGLSPNISQAIAPRLAMESEAIGANFRGIQAEQAGAAARGNLPVSIKNALASALNVSQERAQRDARRGAMSESEALRRQDTAQVLDLLALLLGNKPGQTQQGPDTTGQIMQVLGSVLGGWAQSGFKTS